MKGPVDVELLEQLEAQWRAQRAPLVRHLRRGLTDREMDATTEPIGVRLPWEARVWWGWHDGVAREHYGVKRGMGGPGFQFMPLSEAVVRFTERREVAQRSVLSADAFPEWADPDHWWNPAWLPITESAAGVCVTCDCSVLSGRTSPILAVDWGSNEASDMPVAGSFGEVVSWWLDALRVGAWRFDRGLHRWLYDDDRIPSTRQMTGAV